MRSPPLLYAVLLVASTACTDQNDPVAPLSTEASSGPRFAAAASSVRDSVSGHYSAAVAVPGGITFRDAKRLAMQAPHPVCGWGYLAAVTSAAENTFIIRNATAAVRPTPGFKKTYGYWLGATKVGNNWTWISGEQWGYFPKAPVTTTARTAISYWARTAAQTSPGLFAPNYSALKMPGYLIEWESCSDASIPYGYDPNDTTSVELPPPPEEEEEVVIDDTPPTISAAISGTLGTDGWYTSDVAITWSVEDLESSVTEQIGCDAVAVNEDTAGSTFTCTASSLGGTTEQSVTIKRDATAPLLTGAASGTVGAGGWFTSDVLIEWNATDNVSGVGSTEQCASFGSADGEGIEIHCTVTNGAGLEGHAVVTYDRDASAPTVVGAVSGRLGENGWYTSDVEIEWRTADNLSGIAEHAGCARSTDEEGAGITVTCEVVNGAGLVGVGTVTFRRDVSAPTVSGAVGGTLGENGWYTSDVSIAWHAVERTSGVESTRGCANDGRADGYFVVVCEVVNRAGLVGTGTVTYKRDASAPEVDGTLAGRIGNDGWYVSDVLASWSHTDPTSGISSISGCAAPRQEDTAGSTLDCSATNGAGLESVRSLQFKRDATAPIVTYRGAAASYTVDERIAITCEATDNLSGIAENGCRNIAGDAYNFSVGQNTFASTAVDVAGNETSSQVTFTVRATFASVANVGVRCITNRGIGNSLVAKLNAAERLVVPGLRRALLVAFQNEVRALRGKHIPVECADRLAKLVSYL